MEPNLKRRKTTFVLALRGKGTQKARQVYFAKHGDALWLPDMAVMVPVVPQYMHLGGIVDKDANMAAEMRHRLALAGAAYDSGKTLLFQNSRVELTTRAKLFETSICASFFNLGNWIPDGPAWDSLQSGYSRLLRKLLVPLTTGQDLYEIPLSFVHLVTGCWQLNLLAMRSRLGRPAELPHCYWAAPAVGCASK